jgi:hypothetical protein
VPGYFGSDFKDLTRMWLFPVITVIFPQKRQIMCTASIGREPGVESA